MVEAQGEKLSVAQLSTFVREKRDLYEVALRNGFYLPSYKSQAITEEYLVEVLRGTYWCPKYSEIRMLPCVKAPSKDVLLAKFREATLLHEKLAVYIDVTHPPDSKWLLDVVATLMPWDEIFQKGYVPPPRRGRQADLKVIELPANLFEGIPISKSKAKVRRLRLIGHALTEARLERLTTAQKEIADQIQKEKLIQADHAKLKKSLRVAQKPFSAEELKQGDIARAKTSLAFLTKGGGTLASDVGGNLRGSGPSIGPQDRPGMMQIDSSEIASGAGGSSKKPKQ